MTHLRHAMLEELQRRNYAKTTVNAYIHAVEQFAKHFKRRPDRLTVDHLRTYQAYLVSDRKLGPRTVRLHVAALRFSFVKTLRRRYLLDDTPYPKAPRRLPTKLLWLSSSKTVRNRASGQTPRHLGCPRTKFQVFWTFTLSDPPTPNRKCAKCFWGVVSRNFTSWNQLDGWLRQVDGLRQTA